MGTGTIEHVVEQEKQAARAEFIEACWRGVGAAELLALARAADIETNQADRIRAEIVQAMALIPRAADVLAARAEYERVQQRGEKAERKAQALEAKAERIRMAPIEAIETAREAMSVAEDATRELMAMHSRRPELVPVARLPEALREIKRRHAIERREAAEHQARRDHEERIRAAERYIETLKERLHDVPVSVDKAAHERAIEAEIEKVQAAVKKAKAAGPEIVAA